MSEVDSPQLKKRKMSSEPNGETVPLAPVSNLLIKRHSEKAKLPTRGSALAAGYDLYRYASLDSFCLHDVDLGIVLKRRLSPLMAKPSLIHKSRSLSLLELMGEWLPEVALVRVFVSNVNYCAEQWYRCSLQVHD